MLNAIINHLLVFSGWSAILLVFLLPALESSVFLGFVIPGETAVVVGGFLAYEHKVSLAAILAAGILGAIVGDSIGFAVGERWGDSLLARLPKRLIKPEHVTQGKQMITRLGGRAVFAGRWVSVLRALVPGLCGTSGMRYATFLLWNAIGGITWATLYTMVGYLAGSAWERVEHYTSVVSYALVGVIAIAIAVVVFLKHRRQSERDAETRQEAAESGRLTEADSDRSAEAAGATDGATGTLAAAKGTRTEAAGVPAGAVGMSADPTGTLVGAAGTLAGAAGKPASATGTAAPASVTNHHQPSANEQPATPATRVQAGEQSATTADLTTPAVRKHAKSGPAAARWHSAAPVASTPAPAPAPASDAEGSEHATPYSPVTTSAATATATSAPTPLPTPTSDSPSA